MFRQSLAILALAVPLSSVLAMPYCPQPKICRIIAELGSNIDGSSKLGTMINNSGHTLQDFLQLFCTNDANDDIVASAVLPAPQPTGMESAIPNPSPYNTQPAPAPTGQGEINSDDHSQPDPIPTSAPSSSQDNQDPAPSSGNDISDAPAGNSEESSEALDDGDEQSSAPALANEETAENVEESPEADDHLGQGESTDTEDDCLDEHSNESIDDTEEDVELPGDEEYCDEADESEGDVDDPLEDEESPQPEGHDSDDREELADDEEGLESPSQEAPDEPLASASESAASITSVADAGQSTASSSSSTLLPEATPTIDPSGIETVPQFLEAHNILRGIYDRPELTWDENLAESAAAWAAECKMEHSQHQTGENLAGGAGRITFSEAFNSWVQDQEDKFRAGNLDESRHFSQIIRTGASALGCGMAHCAPGTVLGAEYGEATMFVCQYGSDAIIEGDDEDRGDTL